MWNWLRILAVAALALHAQEPKEQPVEFVCPMDPDVRSKGPGKCTRCGMKLEAGIPDGVAFKVRISSAPKAIIPGSDVDLTMEVVDPRKNLRAKQFEEVHERLFHFFLVSEDLQFFAHVHPVKDADALFQLRVKLPKPGYYRALSDFYPTGATPQMVASSLFASGTLAPASPLKADTSIQHGSNLDVGLVTEPSQPLAGQKTMLFFSLKPGSGLEQYLGAWGHLLAVSEDLVDAIHTHPAFGDSPPRDGAGASRIQFNLIFPRPGIYRVWVQFQREGKLNTIAFNIPVQELR